MSLHHQIFKVIKQQLPWDLVPSSSVFCREFTSLRLKCLMAPTLFCLAASRMSQPQIPFKSKIFRKRSDAQTCLESLKAPTQELEETCKRLKRAKQWSQNELTVQSFWRWKKSGQHAKLQHAQDKHCHIPVVPGQADGRSCRGGKRTQAGAGPDLMWCDAVGCEVKQGDVRLGGGRLWG